MASLPAPPMAAFRKCEGPGNKCTKAEGVLKVDAAIRYMANMLGITIGEVGRRLLPGCPRISSMIPVGRTCKYNITVGTPRTGIPVHTLHGLMRRPGFNKRIVIITLKYRGLAIRGLLSRTSVSPRGMVILRRRGNFSTVMGTVVRVTSGGLTVLSREEERALPLSSLYVNVRYNKDSTFSNIDTGPSTKCTTSVLMGTNTAMVFSRIARMESNMRCVTRHYIDGRIYSGLTTRVG